MVCKRIPAEIGESQNFGHFRVIDFFGGIRCVVIVGVKSGKPPKGGDIFKNERKLVAAEEDVESGFVVEAIVERQTDMLIFSGNSAVVIGAVERADQISMRPVVWSLRVSLRPIMSKLIMARVVSRGRRG